MTGATMDPTWTAFLRDLEQVRGATPRLADVELRASDDGDDETLGTMAGHFSVFNVWYEVNSFFEGHFLERIAPGAFARTFDHFRSSGGTSIKVLFNHGHDRAGDMVLGTISDLREDDTGAYYEVPLFDTSYNRDLLPGLKAQPPAYGSSFRFRVIVDEWNEEPGTSDHNQQGIPERTIREMRVMEFGPVTFPANPAATAGIRSLTDRYYEKVRQFGEPADRDHAEQLLARAREIRTPDSDPARQGTSDDGPASSTTQDPPDGTPGGPTPGERERVLRELHLEGSDR